MTADNFSDNDEEEQNSETEIEMPPTQVNSPEAVYFEEEPQQTEVAQSLTTAAPETTSETGLHPNRFENTNQENGNLIDGGKEVLRHTLIIIIYCY